MADPDFSALNVTALGGGHGLYQTLRAVRALSPAHIDAVVTVADDGGSSGRIRRELGVIPPGDLRMALAALATEDEEGRLWRDALQHRFGGSGALAGHAMGNLLIVGLAEVAGSMQRALDLVAKVTRSAGRVLPVATTALDIEADVAGLDDDPRVMRVVRGQVAVASTTGSVRRVRVVPEAPAANPFVTRSIQKSGLVTLGPGSWFSSVVPHVLVPDVARAVGATEAVTVVVLNLSDEPGETEGFSMERHLHTLAAHAPGLAIDYVLADSSVVPAPGNRRHLERAAERLGAHLVIEDVRYFTDNGRRTDRHDPDLLAAALKRLVDAGRQRH